jgi:two-component system response regulator
VKIQIFRIKKKGKKMDAEILLVEDNINDAELAIRALRKNNVANNLVHLPDGAEALDYLFGKGKYAGRNINNKPKVILLDLKMPKVGGIEVLKRIKAVEETKTIPVVVLTSSKENLDLEEAYQLGANSYIVKPVDFENFKKAVAEIGTYWLVYNHPAV